MIVLLIFTFLSGLVTIAAPCIWPLLPIILSSAATGGHRRPLGVTLGIMTSFSILTVSLAYLVHFIPFDTEILRYVAVVIIALLGISLLVPQIGAYLEGMVSRLSGKFGRNTTSPDTGFKSGYLTGLSLGVVWTPCAGPILATVATLAATRRVNADILLILAVYIIGVGIPLFLFALAGRRIFTKIAIFSKYTGRIQQIFGGVMVVTAILIGTGYDRILQAKLLTAFPSYSQFLVKLETSGNVEEKLDEIRNSDTKDSNQKPIMKFPDATTNQAKLPYLGKAPDFAGITQWLNSDPLTIDELRGKVVLIDFWTYTCINCIRTLPYVTSWYETYKDENFIVVGVHAPEFEFEKKTENVKQAIKQHEITYPVAQDNDFETWRAYDNRYWPAKYLIDAEGYVRYTHFGEGEYDVTERNIQTLLAEAGSRSNKPTPGKESRSVTGPQTPETYLGLKRMQNFVGDTSLISLSGKSVFSKAPQTLPQDSFTYEGTWTLTDEYGEAGTDAALLLHFRGKKVFLVITPKKAGDTIDVSLDGKPIGDTRAGVDVTKGKIILDEARLYEIVNTKNGTDSGVLRLGFDNAQGTQVFAFTFGS